MKLESIDTIYHDGGHNAFTSIVWWKDRYWVCFRNAKTHRSLDGRVCVISSSDMKRWSQPVIVMDTSEDNRDPKLFVFNDRLHITSMTIDRSYEFSDTCEGNILTKDFFSLVSFTEDGIHWSEPRRTWEPFKGLWWSLPHAGRVYGSGYLNKPIDDNGDVLSGSSICQRNSTEFVVSDDGISWETISVISRDRWPSECAVAFLPDKRAVAFLRHDDESNLNPEIKLASPPYTQWETIYDFPYFTNGPCLGMVGNTLVAASRAILDWDSTPSEITALAVPGAVRGLLLMTIDVDKQTVTPQHVISCPKHPEDDWPDISYAGILDLGNDIFAASYYEGLKKQYSDIKLAILRL